MLLNKLPALDKGYVAYLDSSNSGQKLKEYEGEFFKYLSTPQLQELSTLTLVFKCPLFVQLNLSTHNFKIISTPPADIEAFLPSVGEVGAPDHKTNKIISEDMERTTAALLINPKAYQADGCDRFMSQVLTPISTYTTIIVHGSYSEWRKFCSQSRIPASIQSYANLVLQIIKAEWK